MFNKGIFLLVLKSSNRDELNVNLLKFAKTDASHCMQTLPHIHTFWFCSDHKVTKTCIEKQLFPHCSTLDVVGCLRQHIDFWLREQSTRWMFADIWLCITSWRSPFSKWQVMVIYLSQSLSRKFTKQIHLLLLLL